MHESIPNILSHLLILIPRILLIQYPNILTLQAIVGQGVTQAPSQGDQAAATAAAAVATVGDTKGVYFNPMAWLAPKGPTTSVDSKEFTA